MERQERTASFYKLGVQYEWDRLERDPFHRLELDTSLKYLEKYLPKQGLVLDAGGGPGRYTMELARRGYEVVLLDIVQENLDFAKKILEKENLLNNVKDFVQGSVSDLSDFSDSSFDAVICTGGPISHVPTGKLREKAVGELTRVAKVGAPIFISVMAKYGALPLFINEYANEIGMTDHFRDFWQNGDDDRWGSKKSAFAHYFTYQELNELMVKNGLDIVTNVGLESFATPAEEEFNKVVENKKVYDNWLEMHYALCEEEAALNASIHILSIGKKK
jgi:ubiquinone/menaquinone biosynthesis C-methylase UbiE